MFFYNKVIHALHKCLPAALWLILFLFCTYLPPEDANGEEPQYQGLPFGKGRAEVLENCTICHSSAIILQNHMSRKKWDQTLTWMQDKQGLWDLQPGLRKIILDYLSTYQGVKKSTSELHNSMGHKYTYRSNPL